MTQREQRLSEIGKALRDALEEYETVATLVLIDDIGEPVDYFSTCREIDARLDGAQWYPLKRRVRALFDGRGWGAIQEIEVYARDATYFVQSLPEGYYLVWRCSVVGEGALPSKPTRERLRFRVSALAGLRDQAP